MRRIGPYEIRHKFAEGGMGVVYKARDRRHGGDVALKVLHQRMRADPEGRARFLREAQALEGVSHPNLATVYESGEVETSAGLTLYLAMEFVPGHDLYHKLSFEELATETVVDIGRQVAAGLSAAHAAGVVHRDLKPSNIRMSRGGAVKVLDFGLAKVASSPDAESPGDGFETRVGMVVGTAPYTSPEQLRGEPVDARADLFSLGVVLYQLTTGRLPFRGASRWELLSEIEKREPETMNSHGVAVDPAFERIVSRLLRCFPGELYTRADEVEADLAELYASMVAAVPESPTGAETAGPIAAPRRPAVIAGLFVLVVLLVWLALRLTGVLP